MTPNRYTELFFLDEATGLAAGHRPCSECRRGRFVAFRDAWAAGNVRTIGPKPIRVKVIDDKLHAERVGPDRSKQTYSANLDDLPDGVLVILGGLGGDAYLVKGHELLAWSPGGYRDRGRRPLGGIVTVLTPGSTVRAIRAGYVPEIILRRPCERIVRRIMSGYQNDASCEAARPTLAETDCSAYPGFLFYRHTDTSARLSKVPQE